MRTIADAVDAFLKQYPPSLEIFRNLKAAGNLCLIGGVLREYRDKGDIQQLRDIDIIIDITCEKIWMEFLDKYHPARNSFGGYKVLCQDFILDVWILRETWAYRENIISCAPEDYIRYLPETVFLNLDAVIYDLKNDVWYDQKYQEAVKKNEIDVVLEKNPQIMLNIVRAFVLKKRYAMSFSKKLINIIEREKCTNGHFIKHLMDVQEERYKKIIIAQRELEEMLHSIENKRISVS